MVRREACFLFYKQTTGYSLFFSSAGCVIECDLLAVLQKAFLDNPSIENVLLDEK